MGNSQYAPLAAGLQRFAGLLQLLATGSRPGQEEEILTWEVQGGLNGALRASTLHRVVLGVVQGKVCGGCRVGSGSLHELVAYGWDV